MKIYWQCDVCGKKGLVRYWFFRDWLYILNKIIGNHRKISPQCKNTTDKVQISTGE